MSAFNTVRAELVCPSCGRTVAVSVQFKYGDTWQQEYTIGDHLRWGGNQIGLPGAKRVVLNGTVESCPRCGYEKDWGVYVYVDDDKVSRVVVATGEYDFIKEGKSFIKLE